MSKRDYTVKVPQAFQSCVDLVATINVDRKALGVKPIAELPKGTRREPERCPLTKAFAGTRIAAVGDQFAYTDHRETARKLSKMWLRPYDERASEWRYRIMLPYKYQMFIFLFDGDAFPEYDDEQSSTWRGT